MSALRVAPTTPSAIDTASGILEPPVELVDLPEYATAVALGDVDGDGLRDAVFAHLDSLFVHFNLSQ